MSRNNQNNISRELIDDDNDEKKEEQTEAFGTPEEQAYRRMRNLTPSADFGTPLSRNELRNIYEMNVLEFNLGPSPSSASTRSPPSSPEIQMHSLSNEEKQQWDEALRAPLPEPEIDPILQVTNVNGTQVLMLDELRQPPAEPDLGPREQWRGVYQPTAFQQAYFNEFTAQRRATNPRGREPGIENIPPEEMINLESKEEIPQYEEEEEDDAVVIGLKNEYESLMTRLQEIARQIYDTEEEYQQNIYELRKPDIEYYQERMEEVSRMIMDYQENKRNAKKRRLEREAQSRRNMR